MRRRFSFWFCWVYTSWSQLLFHCRLKRRAYRFNFVKFVQKFEDFGQWEIGQFFGRWVWQLFFLTYNFWPHLKNNSDQTYSCPRYLRHEGPPETLRTITALYRIEGFKEGHQLGPHCAERLQPLGQRKHFFLSGFQTSRTGELSFHVIALCFL